MRWVGHVACMEEKRTHTGCLIGQPEAKKLLGRHGRVGRALKCSLIERDVECINLAQDRRKKQDVIKTAVTL